MAKKLTLLTTKDIVFLSIFATIFGVGFILGFLGFIADFLNVASQDNWIKNADGAVQEFLSINLSFLEWGSIFLVTGASLLALTLNVIAQREQVEIEKKARRAQRLQEASE
jgi:hypothetical protein